LARQFGYATGSGRALRTATGLEDGEPDPKLYDELWEAHERGSILVAAVFDAFFRIYRTKVADLVRAVTGGSGILPEGELQADLLPWPPAKQQAQHRTSSRCACGRSSTCRPLT